MARDFWVNGESMVYVKGASASYIANLTELGLSEGPIRIIPSYRHKDINLDAWGLAAAEVQFMLAECQISMTLIHFDRTVLAACLQESLGATPLNEGTMNRAGARLGNGAAPFAATNHFISLNISSPVAGLPWKFPTTYLTGPPMEFPLGTEKSSVVLNWRAIPYTTDPYNGGLGALGTVLWTHTADS